MVAVVGVRIEYGDDDEMICLSTCFMMCLSIVYLHSISFTSFDLH